MGRGPSPGAARLGKQPGSLGCKRLRAKLGAVGGAEGGETPGGGETWCGQAPDGQSAHREGPVGGAELGAPRGGEACGYGPGAEARLSARGRSLAGPRNGRVLSGLLRRVRCRGPGVVGTDKETGTEAGVEEGHGAVAQHVHWPEASMR